MKKTVGLLVSFMLLVSGCGLSNSPEESETEKSQEIGTEKTAGAEGRDYLQYKVNPKQFSENRGMITQRLNNRIDMNGMETGLMTLSQEYFPADKLNYQEGQQLKDLSNWVYRKSTHKEGLNPAVKISDNMNWEEKMEVQKKNPVYLAHIQEQNYVDKDGKIKGISIGLGLNSIDYIKIQDEQGLTHFGEVDISQKKMKTEGKKIAEEVINRIRKKANLKNVPILISLFELGEKNSVIPGNYFTYAFVDDDQNSIKKWEDLNRKYYLFPSDDGKEKDKDISDRLLDIEEYVNEYFTTTDIKLVSQGLYVDNELEKMVINVSTNMVKYPETVAFVQAFTPAVSDYFPHTPVYMYVNSPEGMKATIIKEPSEEPIVHIHDEFQ
ncbi:CamS family sex pheromone protein [Rossellomorea sp. BNER]|uniref:CamS family sex pheromone protein n=1 Tax=Rossellomorea sp. BNER TaxID=2962031 RepID=UPI003AF22C0E|nr:CamS family sex pheromone protein [Rossellomorea sp. BNER]